MRRHPPGAAQRLAAIPTGRAARRAAAGWGWCAAEKELKAFWRVTLVPGETRTVRLPITPAMLAFYDINKKYTVVPGEFTLMVGSSSRSEDLHPVTLRVR